MGRININKFQSLYCKRDFGFLLLLFFMIEILALCPFGNVVLVMLFVFFENTYE